MFHVSQHPWLQMRFLFSNHIQISDFTYFHRLQPSFVNLHGIHQATGMQIMKAHLLVLNICNNLILATIFSWLQLCGIWAFVPTATVQRCGLLKKLTQYRKCLVYHRYTMVNLEFFLLFPGEVVNCGNYLYATQEFIYHMKNQK